MLTASVKNMLVTSIDITLETGVVPTKYIVIISTVRCLHKKFCRANLIFY